MKHRHTAKPGKKSMIHFGGPIKSEQFKERQSTKKRTGYTVTYRDYDGSTHKETI